MNYGENGRPYHYPQQFRGNMRRVFDPEYGWITVDSSYLVPPSTQVAEQKPEDTITPKTPMVPVYVVREQKDVDNILVDTNGKTQIFVEKEDNEEVNVVHLRQLNLETGLTAFETYKRVIKEDIPTVVATEEPTVVEQKSSVPDGLIELLIPTVEKLNNKLDSINEGILLVMDEVRKDSKGEKSNDKSGNNRAASGNNSSR